jgi:hypothetical protein
MGDIDWKGILEMLMYFNTENRICSYYTFATGPFKTNPIHFTVNEGYLF